MPGADFERFLGEWHGKHPWLPDALARHYARLYGTRAAKIIGAAEDLKGLGRHFGGLLYQREIDYLRAEEWAMTAEDVLDRRTKHGLHLTVDQRAGVARFMAG